jgi:hypothetical protein
MKQFISNGNKAKYRKYLDVLQAMLAERIWDYGTKYLFWTDPITQKDVNNEFTKKVVSPTLYDDSTKRSECNEIQNLKESIVFTLVSSKKVVPPTLYEDCIKRSGSENEIQNLKESIVFMLVLINICEMIGEKNSQYMKNMQNRKENKNETSKVKIDNKENNHNIFDAMPVSVLKNRRGDIDIRNQKGGRRVSKVSDTERKVDEESESIRRKEENIKE